MCTPLPCVRLVCLLLVFRISDYLVSAVLDPSQKTRHLDKYWGAELRQEAVNRAEQIVSLQPYPNAIPQLTDVQYKKRYFELMNAENPSASQCSTSTPSTSKTERQRTRRVLSDDEDSGSEPDDDSGSRAPSATVRGARPLPNAWLQDFHGYLNSPDDLRGMSIVQWWGVRPLVSCVIIGPRR